ncbi:site-specific integrase [Cyanobium sp. AMD-g]|uniref:tyrosine-type recombinase/integrase n=1 Tax=Cyanobium sp. AMD-g TaxID=2823699 RepID=UPI0020CC79C5|nr:site-specific integrase [Cyanobium sp. AMD-g]MCP9930594.1 site-specific integrase [Cyanobium sp. AMD-g]
MPKTAGSGQARTLTPEELDALLDAAPSHTYRALWSVMRFTGSRVSETLALRWGVIHSDRIVFRAADTKTQGSREPMVGASLREELGAYREFWTNRRGKAPQAADLVFPSPRLPGQPLTRAAADLALRTALKTLGDAFPSGVSLHTFRRSLATTMSQRGASLKTVARFTGHANLGQLQNYIDVSHATEAAALAVIDG